MDRLDRFEVAFCNQMKQFFFLSVVKTGLEPVWNRFGPVWKILILVLRSNAAVIIYQKAPSSRRLNLGRKAQSCSCAKDQCLPARFSKDFFLLMIEFIHPSLKCNAICFVRNAICFFGMLKDGIFPKFLNGNNKF